MKISPKLFPLFVLVPFALALGAAKVSGYWQPKGGRGCGAREDGETMAGMEAAAPGPGDEGFECPLEDICEFEQCDPTACGILDGECTAKRVLDPEPGREQGLGAAGAGCDGEDDHDHGANMLRGYNTLADAAQHYGLSPEEVRDRLGIDEHIRASTQLKAIADKTGCSVHDLRDLLEGGE